MKDLEAVTYKRGYRDGFAEANLEAYDRLSIAAIEAEKSARIEAFGAIRRAAEVARRFDSRASFHGFDDDECDDYIGAAWGHAAKELRIAIRAAIGSDKA